jgi:hypothetical protein
MRCFLFLFFIAEILRREQLMAAVPSVNGVTTNEEFGAM